MGRRGSGLVARGRGTQTKVCATFLLAAGMAFAQKAAPAPDPNSGSFEGVVTNAVTGEPVPHAHVTLFSFAAGQQKSYGAMTTAEGKFSVTGLPGGLYGASADRLGFVLSQHGSTNLELKPGEHKNDLKLKLTPTGAIAGTVVDADGEPVENCSVTAESSRDTKGSATDAQGRFRIGGLTPGKYRIKARPDELQTPPEIRTDGTVEVSYAETYYPSALDASGAAKVSVPAGSEASGTEIRLVRTPIVRVSGKVTGIMASSQMTALMVERQEDESPVPGLGSFTMNRNWGGGSTRVRKDGTFALWRLSPGPYRIRAVSFGPMGPAAASAPVDVVVGDSHVDGLELRLIPPGDLTGQVEYESDDARPTPPAQGAQIWLEGLDGADGKGNGRLDSGGAFTFEKVTAGRYQVRWGGRGYVKSMRLGTAEIEGDTLDLSNGAGGAALTVLISAQFGSVSGAVRTDGAMAAGMNVLLVADRQGPRGVRQILEVGADGTYSDASVIPGDYKLVVIAKEDVDAILQGGDEWDDYAPVIENVTIRAGEKTTQDLKALNRP